MVPKQRFYPQCRPCSDVQSIAVRTGKKILVRHNGGAKVGAACAAAADPNAIWLGGMWSPTTFPTRDPQWWHPSRRSHPASVRLCASVA